MAKRVGSRLDRGISLEPVNRKMDRRSPGLVRRQDVGRTESGGLRSPTILEAYNRNSDFKRWQEGQQIHYGASRSWADYQIPATSMLLLDNGCSPFSQHITTLFPSRTSPEGNWAVTTLVRGSIILPTPVLLSEITVLTNDAGQPDRIALDVSASLSSTQVANWAMYVGFQFEDSATGPSYPDDLILEPANSLALTLIEAKPSTQELIFDLTRAYARVRFGQQVYWKRLAYDPTAPVYWRSNGTRHLCNSYAFHCACPDHSGRVYTDTLRSTSPLSKRNPTPSAGRQLSSEWEAGSQGLYAQFRDLPARFDQRRECKHIHAIRWSCNVPFYEPTDYPLGDDSAVFSGNRNRFGDDTFWTYHAKRTIELDRLTLSAAEVVGLELNPSDDLLNPVQALRTDDRPILWNLPAAPDPALCRAGDWFLRRGTQELTVFNDSLQRFVQRAPINATETRDVFRVYEPGEAGAPSFIP